MEAWELDAREQIRDLVAAYNAHGDRGRVDDLLRGPDPWPGLSRPAQVTAVFWLLLATAVLLLVLPRLWRLPHRRRFTTLALVGVAIVPMVLEARGLDVTPATVTRFRAQGDAASAKILERIYIDEIRHVSAGTVWFNWMCDELGFAPAPTWQTLVKSRFRGVLKPPFNDSARRDAGLTQEYYAVIAS